MRRPAPHVPAVERHQDVSAARATRAGRRTLVAPARHLLLIDGDSRGLRVLEVALARQGFTVVTAGDADAALQALQQRTPDLIISETKLEPRDGFALCAEIRANPEWRAVPFVFLTTATDIEHKVRGLSLGVDDYLTKPIYIKEIVARLELITQKRSRTRMVTGDPDGNTRMVGRLADMKVHELIQTVEFNRKSGVIQLAGHGGRQAAIYFRDGRVIDAEAGPLQGEDAVYRLLTWTDGAFEVIMRTVRRRDVIKVSTQALLMEGMRRLDEWTRLLEQLPALETRFDVDAEELLPRLAEIPDENDQLLRLIDGKRTLLEVIDASEVGDLESLQAFARFYFEGVLVESLLPAPTPPPALLDAPPVWQRSERTARLSMPPDNETLLPELAAAGLARDVRARASDDEATATTAELADEPSPTERSQVDSTPPPLAPAPPPEPPPPLALPRTHTGPIASQLGAVSLAFRPSGLRLVDEAVAAAQLHADLLPEWMRDMSPDGGPAADAAPPSSDPGIDVPDDDDAIIETSPVGEPEITDPNAAPIPEGMELNAEGQLIPSRPESSASMRMRASYGAMRAALAGEVAAPVAVTAAAAAPARELMTIRPRQAAPAPALAPPPSVDAGGRSTQIDTSGSSASEADVITSSGVPAPAAPADSRPRRLPTRPPPGPSRRGRDTALVPARVLAAMPGPLPARRRSAAPVVLLALVGVAAIVLTVLLVGRCQRAARHTLPTRPLDGAALDPAGGPGSGSAVALGTDLAVDARAAVTLVPDARAAGSGSAAAVAPADAPGKDAAPTPGYREYRDSAQAALEALDFPAAVELANQSLSLKRSARTYLIRAEAENYQGDTKAALESIAAAIGMAGTYAPAWLLRGDVLWGAGRRDDALAAYARFLQLQPKGRDADRARKRVAGG
jgi:DNA-binding response OmpR family regulator